MNRKDTLKKPWKKKTMKVYSVKYFWRVAQVLRTKVRYPQPYGLWPFALPKLPLPGVYPIFRRHKGAPNTFVYPMPSGGQVIHKAHGIKKCLGWVPQSTTCCSEIFAVELFISDRYLRSINLRGSKHHLEIHYCQHTLSDNLQPPGSSNS